MTLDATSFVLGAGIAFTISIVDRWVQQARARKELDKILAMPRPVPIRIEDVPGLQPIEPSDERVTPVAPE